MVENREKLAVLIDRKAPKPTGFVSADDILTSYRITYDSDANAKSDSQGKPLNLPRPGESIKKRNERVFGKSDKYKPKRPKNP